MPIDDRGRPCATYLAPWRTVLPRGGRGGGRDPRRPDAVPDAAVRAFLRRFGYAPRTVLVLVLVPQIVALPTMLLAASATRSVPVVFLSYMSVSYAIGFWAYRFVPFLYWWYWKHEAASGGHCPSCGYSLANSPRQEDGCRVCPECGAAWRAP